MRLNNLMIQKVEFLFSYLFFNKKAPFLTTNIKNFSWHQD